jgi:23S rRNA pseudouridine1911/1915/1917 synthase
MTESAPNTFRIDKALAGQTLAKALRVFHKEYSWNQARELCRRGKVRVNGEIATDAVQRVRAGDQIEINPIARRIKPNVLDDGALIYFDAHVAVVNKGAGIISVPCDQDEHNTLVDRTRRLLRNKTGSQRAQLGVVHRLDVGTTGVMVFTRTLLAKRQLKGQFFQHSIERRYLAIAHGEVKPATIETHLLNNRGDGIRGSFGTYRRAAGPIPAGAQRAVTHFKPVKALRGATLVECRLETGRQHQIRIHLSESGHPVVGENVYIRNFAGPVIPADRPMLHAAVLGFIHPSTLEPMRFEADPPQDFTDLLGRLSRG